jgi:outer membrane protein
VNHKTIAGIWCAVVLYMVGGVSVGSPAPDTGQQAQGALTIAATTIESGTGQGHFSLYDSADAYDARRPLFTASRPVTEGQCLWVTPPLPSGTYMVSFYHDLNSNGRLDRTAIGIPREPVAFSNNARPRFGPPRYERMTFAHDGLDSSLQLATFEALGRRGRIGLGVGAIVKENPYDSDAARLIAIPMITYMGDRLSVTGPEISYLLTSRRAVALSARLRYSFDGFDIEDSDRLQGMHERDDTVMAGLRLRWLPAGKFRIGVGLETDMLGEHNGQTVEAEAGYRIRVKDVEITPGVGLKWLSRKTADHLYGVRPTEATTDRRAYSPGDVASPSVQLGARYSITDATALFAAAEWTWFDDAIQKSPIVVRDGAFSLFAAVAYSL